MGNEQKVRDIAVLLELLKGSYNKMINTEKQYRGLCYCISDLCLGYNIINTSESLLIRNYLKDNVPYDVFYRHGNNFRGFWYSLDNTDCRNDWLDKHIKLNTK
jgi:hypothetical protein